MPMTITDVTVTVGATELSIPRNAAYLSGSPQTTVAWVGAVLNVSDLALGDEIQVTVYETIGAEQLPVHRVNIAGPWSTAHYSIPPVPVGSGWDVTVKWISGTERSVTTRLSVTTGDSAATIAAAVMDDESVHAGYPLDRVLRIIAAAVAGKKTGDVFRNLLDTLDQITGTSNADGDRTAAAYGA